jgi:hypothetical protein
MKNYRLLVPLSIVQLFWLWMIARQNNFLLIGAVMITFVLLMRHLLNKLLALNSPFHKAGIGAIAGYLAAVLAVFFAECSVRGLSCFSNIPIGNFYFFPLVSLGWLYGGLVFLGQWKSQKYLQD